MISCSKCKKATLPVSDGGCIKTGGIVDIGCENGEPRILTNYDRVISKSPEKLAAWFNSYFTCPPKTTCPMGEASCEKCWLGWLKQEATDV